MPDGVEAFQDLLYRLGRTVSPDAVRAAFGAALVGNSAVREAMRVEAEEQEQSVRLAVLAGTRTDWRDRWFREAERREEECRMTRAASLRSVFEDVAAGRMR